MDWRRSDDGRVRGTGVYITAEIEPENERGPGERTWLLRVGPRRDGRQTSHYERRHHGFSNVDAAIAEAERIEREEGPEIASQT